jgi:hypothetical protein
MKTLSHGVAQGRLRSFQLCGSAANAITIAGQTFVPDAATAYVEFFMAHAFPLYLDVPDGKDRAYYSTMHPQVIANSYRSLVGKPVNLAHLIKAYNPEKITKDHVFGTVMAVEFGETPADGWKVQGDPALAPGIRAVAALHKNVEGVSVVIDTWNQGVTPFTDTPWTVSMENEGCLTDGGFLIQCGPQAAECGVVEFWESTPEDFRALGWVYVPYGDAPKSLLACQRDDKMLGLKKDYQGYPTLFLNGGLAGQIFFFGVALVPLGRESAARIGRICASAKELVDVSEVFSGLHGFAEKFLPPGK